MGSIGWSILNNIKEYGFNGGIYPVNPKAEEILGLKCYKSVLDVPDEVDFAVIVVPSRIVPIVLEECGKKGVKAVQIISSGFKELGTPEGVELEKKIVEIGRKYNVRIIGPNTFGLVYTPSKINASFGPREVVEGSIAFITQSGALGIALMGWTILEEIGLSALVSEGNKCDVDEADLLEFFAQDPHTKVVTIYLEGFAPGEGRRFFEVAKKFTKIKPLIVVKGGRSELGEKAVASHTGSLAGSDKIYDAVFKQSGIIRALYIDQMFEWAIALSLGSSPAGSKVVAITNGGGAGVQFTDAACDWGLDFWTPLPEDIQSMFRKYMPPFGSPRNPVDLTGQAGIEAYEGAVYEALMEPRIGSVAVLYCRVAILDPMDFAKAVINAVNRARNEGVEKSVVVGAVGGIDTLEAIKYLRRNKIPAYATPERAAAALSAIHKWAKWVGIVKE